MSENQRAYICDPAVWMIWECDRRFFQRDSPERSVTPLNGLKNQWWHWLCLRWKCWKSAQINMGVRQTGSWRQSLLSSSGVERAFEENRLLGTERTSFTERIETLLWLLIIDLCIVWHGNSMTVIILPLGKLDTVLAVRLDFWFLFWELLTIIDSLCLVFWASVPSWLRASMSIVKRCDRIARCFRR